MTQIAEELGIAPSLLRNRRDRSGGWNAGRRCVQHTDVGPAFRPEPGGRDLLASPRERLAAHGARYSKNLRRDGDHDMTQEQKIIRVKVGLLELAKQLGKVKPSLQDDGVQPGQLLPLQGAVRQRRRAGVAGDQPQEAHPEEPHADRDRRGGGRAGDRAAGLGPGAGLGGAEAARIVDFSCRRALRMPAPRPDFDEAPPQGARC